jgi:hypothetical protein
MSVLVISYLILENRIKLSWEGTSLWESPQCSLFFMHWFSKSKGSRNNIYQKSQVNGKELYSGESVEVWRRSRDLTWTWQILTPTSPQPQFRGKKCYLRALIPVPGHEFLPGRIGIHCQERTKLLHWSVPQAHPAALAGPHFLLTTTLLYSPCTLKTAPTD